MKRVLYTYTGEERGPLLICFGAIHGNENAGILALERLLEMLKEEPSKNPNFLFKGRLVAIRGNVKANKLHQRYIKKDLNRHWTLDNVAKVKRTPAAELDPEDQEMKALLEAIKAVIKDYAPKKVIILDIHTTTAYGGIFTIPSHDPESNKIALQLHAPVIHGILKGLSGTTLHYFKTENFDVPMVSLTFEAGQHDDPESVRNATSALVNCLRAIGCVPPKDIEAKHDNWLYERSKDLIKKTKLVYRHPITEADNFQMKPGFKNFQYIPKDTILATDKNGEVKAHIDAFILMPLYQKQGEDGFFLIEEVE